MFMRSTKCIWKASIALSKEKIIDLRTQHSDNNRFSVFVCSGFMDYFLGGVRGGECAQWEHGISVLLQSKATYDQ